MFRRRRWPRLMLDGFDKRTIAGGLGSLTGIAFAHVPERRIRPVATSGQQ